MTLERRDVLRGALGGAAWATLGGNLGACGPTTLASAIPSDPFKAWFGIDRAVVDRVLAALGSHGADAGDLYFQHTRTRSVSLEDGIVHAASTHVDAGVGLRVVVGEQTGYAFTEDLSEVAMIAAAKTAASIARGQAIVPPVSATPTAYGGYYAIDVPWSQVGIDLKLPLLRTLDAKVRALDPSVTKVSVSWVDSEEKVLVATLGGAMVVDERPMSRLAATVTMVRNGVTQSNRGDFAGRRSLSWYTDAILDELAAKAVDRTAILFDARRPPAGEMPVVLAAGASGILLHEAIGHGMEADFNRKNISIYADMLGKKVAPDFVTIVDDATREHERGALNVDDEGTPGQRTVLVENGVLASYLHDAISAKHYGIASTGSGRRESFRHIVLPRMRCTTMENGPHTREEIIASVDRGIIAETFTNGQVQIGAGDFTFYIKNGWMIEGGKVTYPIKDVNIIGNGPEALRNVMMAADDSKLDSGGWTCGKDGQSVPVSQGLPTVLVSKLTVGGVDA